MTESRLIRVGLNTISSMVSYAAAGAIREIPGRYAYILCKCSKNIALIQHILKSCPDSNIQGANTSVLSAPDGPHVGPMNLAFRVVLRQKRITRIIPVMKYSDFTDLTCKG